MAKYITEVSEDYSKVDRHTGEITELYITRKLDVDEFIMVFFNSCPALMTLTGNYLKVLICCWKHSTYNPQNELAGNIVYNGLGFKQACKENGLGISNAAIDNAISALCKKGFLIKKHRGEYLLNPQYFFRGKITNRSKIDLHFRVDPTKADESEFSNYNCLYGTDTEEARLDTESQR